jgi:hypothetical protein
MKKNPETTDYEELFKRQNELKEKGFQFRFEISDKQKDGREMVFELHKNYSTSKHAILFYEISSSKIECVAVFYETNNNNTFFDK